MRASRAAAKATANLCLVLVMAGCAQNGISSVPPSVPPPPLPSAAPPPLASPPPPPSGKTFIYPERGQSPQQEEFDRGQCYSWAVQQSGFDPANPPAAPPPPPAQAPQGGLFRGAFGGAALGAVGGAIGGNAGEGAAIGAAVGGLFGLMRRAESVDQEHRQQASYAAQQQGVLAQGRASYNRAFGVCMTGRGYSVS